MIPRKCHIKRIYGKNVSDNSENTDVWIDVLRIDELGSVENAGGQVKNIRLKWNDNPATPGQDTASNPARTMRTVRIETDADTGVYFEVKAIDRMLSFDSGQKFIRVFKNDTSNTARQVTKKRVTYRDATLPGSGTWQTYIDALTAASGTVDTEQYVDVELVGAFASKQMQKVEYQADTTRLKQNDQLAAIQTTTTGTAARLDPFQSVVNVQLGGRLVAVVQFDMDFTINSWADIDAFEADVTPSSRAFDYSVPTADAAKTILSVTWARYPTMTALVRKATALNSRVIGLFDVDGLPTTSTTLEVGGYAYGTIYAEPMPVLDDPEALTPEYHSYSGTPIAVTNKGAAITPITYGGVGSFDNDLTVSVAVRASEIVSPYYYGGAGDLEWTLKPYAETDGLVFDYYNPGLSVVGLHQVAVYSLPIDGLSITVGDKTLTPIATRSTFSLTESGQIVSSYTKGVVEVLLAEPEV